MGALDDAIREHLELKRQHGAAEDEIRRAEAEALGPARREPVPDPGALDDAYADAAGEPPPPADSAVHDAPPPPPGMEEPVEALHTVEPPDEPERFVEPEPFAEAEAPLEPPTAVDPLASLEAEPVLEPEPELPPEADPLPVEASGEPGFADRDPLPAEEPIADFAPGEDIDDPDRRRTMILDEPLDELAPLDSAPPPLHHEPGPDEAPAPARPLDQEPEVREEPVEPPPVSPPPAQAAPAEDEDVLEETPDFLQETPEHDRLWFEQKPPRDFDFDD